MALSLPPNLRTALTMLAALKPAPVTMIVCGEPFFLDDLLRLSGLRQKDSRNSGNFSKVLAPSKPVASCMDVAVHQS